MRFNKVIVKTGSTNKASVGDVYLIDNIEVVCTLISKKYVYVGDNKYHRKYFNMLVRDYINKYYRDKSLHYQLISLYCPN